MDQNWNDNALELVIFEAVISVYQLMVSNDFLRYSLIIAQTG